jgi:hypothetical protein
VSTAQLNQYGDHFRWFTKNLEIAIGRYGDLTEEDLTERQKRQVETLINLEDRFRLALIADRHGPETYRAFVHHINSERRNILAARPFFRERQAIFTSEISRALKSGDAPSLYPYSFNWRFVYFVLSTRPWAKSSEVWKLSQEIGEARRELIEMNLPLAISRSRIFWNRTQRSHLEYMDLVQIAAEGLMAAVDKFCLPYSPVFRSVAIGRMVGDFIEQYSETPIHFYPTDKRKIYRANKYAHRFAGSIDFDGLAQLVNKEADPSQHTNATEIASLMAAASCVSADAPLVTSPTDGGGSEASDWLERFASDPEHQPDSLVEESQTLEVALAVAKRLGPIEQKLLKLKGVTL